MQLGDLVRHKVNGSIGKVAGFMKRNNGVMVDYSDKIGIRFRWINKSNLEVIK